MRRNVEDIVQALTRRPVTAVTVAGSIAAQRSLTAGLDAAGHTKNRVMAKRLQAWLLAVRIFRVLGESLVPVIRLACGQPLAASQRHLGIAALRANLNQKALAQVACADPHRV